MTKSECWKGGGFLLGPVAGHSGWKCSLPLRTAGQASSGTRASAGVGQQGGGFASIWGGGRLGAVRLPGGAAQDRVEQELTKGTEGHGDIFGRALIVGRIARVPKKVGRGEWT